MSASNVYKLDRTALRVFKITERPTDSEYWHSRSVEERWEYVEFLRRLNYGEDQCTGRLQRFFEVTEVARG